MRYLNSLEARQTMTRLARERAARMDTIIQHLMDDGHHERFGRTVVDLYRSLTPSQRELMLVDL